jgi:N-acetyl-gamma-glutamyl-phosphate reductase
VNNYSNPAPVGVVGFRGYSGAELARILSRHPAVNVVLLEHRSDPDHQQIRLGREVPKILPATVQTVREEELKLVFLATPADVSMDLVPRFLDTGTRVVDLSGAFRLRDVETHRRWYKEEHTSACLLKEAVYGLPEFYRDQIPNARLLSNPGCYPTAANLAIRPLIQERAVDRDHGIICDAKSGVSGAGRKPSLKTSFCEVTENFSAYGFSDHRHVPEVLQNSGLEEGEFTFTAQLLPLERGILETIYLQTKGLEAAEDLYRIYDKAYVSEPFVRLYSPGKVPDLRAVQRTNFCDIGFVFETKTRRATIVVAEDNLTKGAAGQAVQNMNLMLGFPETEGLL